MQKTHCTDRVPCPGIGWIAISNNRLISADADTVVFHWKDDRNKNGDRQKVTRQATDAFTRCFLIHIVSGGFHRIRHCGLLGSATRKSNIAKIRNLLGRALPDARPETGAEPIPLTLREPRPCRGGPLAITHDGPSMRKQACVFAIQPPAHQYSRAKFPLCASSTPPVAADHHGSHRPRRSFLLHSAQPPAASSFRGLSTWTATTRRRMSKNLQVYEPSLWQLIPA